MCSLRHTNIVNVYGVCTAKPRLGIVMEYCANGVLTHWIASKNKKTMKQKIKILSDIAKGMMFLHDLSIIHRDLKPDNVLVSFMCLPFLT